MSERDAVLRRKCGKVNVRHTWSAAHVCGRKRGHVGAHRCLLATEGSIAKPRKGPCNFAWVNRGKK